MPIFKKCQICGKEYFRKPSRAKINKYCSRKCKYIGMKQNHVNVGSNHGMWKGGKRIVNNYILVHCPSHPFCNKSGYVIHSRLIMEEYLGRYLKPKEIVHHINKNTFDNRIENLKLFNNKSMHCKHHFPKGSIFGKNIY